jgi:hypothetical protein
MQMPGRRLDWLVEMANLPPLMSITTGRDFRGIDQRLVTLPKVEPAVRPFDTPCPVLSIRFPVERLWTWRRNCARRDGAQFATMLIRLLISSDSSIDTRRPDFRAQ